jgi:hypothetical protein
MSPGAGPWAGAHTAAAAGAATASDENACPLPGAAGSPHVTVRAAARKAAPLGTPAAAPRPAPDADECDAAPVTAVKASRAAPAVVVLTPVGGSGSVGASLAGGSAPVFDMDALLRRARSARPNGLRATHQQMAVFWCVAGRRHFLLEDDASLRLVMGAATQLGPRSPTWVEPLASS